MTFILDDILPTGQGYRTVNGLFAILKQVCIFSSNIVWENVKLSIPVSKFLIKGPT